MEPQGFIVSRCYHQTCTSDCTSTTIELRYLPGTWKDVQPTSCDWTQRSSWVGDEVVLGAAHEATQPQQNAQSSNESEGAQQ